MPSAVMRLLFKSILATLDSWIAISAIIGFCIFSFYIGQLHHDMNFFAASGASMTVFGLLSIIRFTTIEKYLEQESIIANSTGMTGPPIPDAKRDELRARNIEAARIRLKAELRTELRGLALTIAGTLIWAYGAYVPILHAPL